MVFLEFLILVEELDLQVNEVPHFGFDFPQDQLGEALQVAAYLPVVGEVIEYFVEHDSLR
jgi:hypothetical protein